MGDSNQDNLCNSETCNPSIKSTAQPELVGIDPTLDRRLLWNRDFVLIPIMGVLYLILFVDRTNIANARALGIGSPTGLDNSLGMPNNGYNTALVSVPDEFLAPHHLPVMTLGTSPRLP